MLELMKLSDLLIRVGDTKKLVCHCLPDILFAESHVALANLVLDVVSWFLHSTQWDTLHVLLGSSGIQLSMFMCIYLLDPVAAVAGIN